MTHTLSRALRFYFRQYLLKSRNASPHTVMAYRQTFELLRRYLKAKRRVGSMKQVRLSQLTPSVLLGFLDHLEDARTGRGNSIATRNVRLAAVRSFFRALPLLSPVYANVSDQMQALPFKRTVTRSPDYLEREELRQVFGGIDPKAPQGLRDLVMLLFMYNMGARAGEVAGARLSWLDLQPHFPSVRILGKGLRERTCPLWEVTRAFLRQYLAEGRPDPRPEFQDRLFINVRRGGFSRWGVWSIVRRHVARAAQSCASLRRKHITAHSIRHSLGVHLLQAGVDMSVIRSWLGHVHLDTTYRYARVRVQDTQSAVERFFRLADVLPAGAPLKISVPLPEIF